MLRAVQNIPPIFRTDTQRRLLVELLLQPNAPRTLSDLARALDVDPTTVMREVDRLADSGLIAERRVGRARTVAIDETSPYATPLRQLLNVSRRNQTQTSDRPVHHAAARTEASRHDRRPLPSSRRQS
jgi:DNA-binding transcriptional ArsR family regulator